MKSAIELGAIYTGRSFIISRLLRLEYLEEAVTIAKTLTNGHIDISNFGIIICDVMDVMYSTKKYNLIEKFLKQIYENNIDCGVFTQFGWSRIISKYK